MNNLKLSENPDYLNSQIITYLGNKRSLLSFIEEGLNIVQKNLDKNKLDIFDAFSGSGIVSRFFKQHSRKLITNDLEKYSQVINSCYLTNYSSFNSSTFIEIHQEILDKIETNLKPGIISELYAPSKDDNIKHGERVFYTKRNAMFLDTARTFIENVPDEFKNYLLAPLLSEASIHANTAGVFKGFYKDFRTGIGKFGGARGDALTRITSDITIPFPIFSNFECETEIYCDDTNAIAESLPEVDLVYIDPPYNQHPYGSNYFMLNLLIDYKKPEKLSLVSGIPANWNRSLYNSAKKSIEMFDNLIQKLKAKYILVSFNSEGFISINQMLPLLEKKGKVTVLERKYNTYRASRNLKNREIHVNEYLYLLKKKD